MELTTGSIYTVRNTPRLQGDQIRALVMRRWPRGVSSKHIDLWLPAAGPSLDLLERYNTKQIGWEEFAAAYRTEQNEATGGWVSYYNTLPNRKKPVKLPISVAPFAWLKNYAKISERGVVLLCHEREGNCHRHILKELIEEE